MRVGHWTGNGNRPAGVLARSAKKNLAAQTNYTAPNAFFFVHTAAALSRRVVVGIAWGSLCAARDNDALRNLGRRDMSNRVNCRRCRACRALVEGYDTRARPFYTRSEGRLRVTGHKKGIGARATSSFELWVGSRVSQPRKGRGQGSCSTLSSDLRVSGQGVRHPRLPQYVPPRDARLNSNTP